MELEQLFPELKTARAYATHGNYDRAVETYSEILPHIEKESISYTHVLLEYALCLLESITYETEINYHRILMNQNQIEREDFNEDIETVWNCLETCRVNYEIVNDSQKLCEVHKGLGDVESFNNRFEESLAEYKIALDLCTNTEDMIEILECMVDSSKSLGKYEDAIEYYKNIIRIHANAGRGDLVEEYKELIETLDLLKAQAKIVEKDKSKDESEEAVNINHLKR